MRCSCACQRRRQRADPAALLLSPAQAEIWAAQEAAAAFAEHYGGSPVTAEVDNLVAAQYLMTSASYQRAEGNWHRGSECQEPK